MKKIVLLLILFVTTNSFVEQENAYTTGEWFKLRIHYGLVNAVMLLWKLKKQSETIKKYIML